MGMAVFSGMLIATVLAVCLIPVLFVAVTKLTGGDKQAKPPGGETALAGGGDTGGD
jgi:hypothetical protein